MEKVYDLHHHPYCAIVYMGEDNISTHIFSTSSRSFGASKYGSVKPTCITYNKQKTDILSWGVSGFVTRDKDHIRIDNFRNELYKVFKKSRKNWDEHDVFLVKGVSDFMSLEIKKSIEDSEMMIENIEALHYVFIVPSEWEEEIRKDLLRLIFVQANLMSKDDHIDRLLFVSDLESTCYHFQSQGDYQPLKRGQNTILCEASRVKGDTASINLNLIQTVNPLFHFIDSKLYPKIMQSSSATITSGDIKKHLTVFLRTKLFPNNGGVDQDETLKTIVEDIYNEDFPEMDPYDDYDDDSDNASVIDKNVDGKSSNRDISEEDKERKRKYDILTMSWITDTSRWKLNKLQAEAIKSISLFDICAEFDQSLFCAVKDLVSSSAAKSYKVLAVENRYSSEVDLDFSLCQWINVWLEYSVYSLGSMTTIYKISPTFSPAFRDDIMVGAAVVAFEAVKNSNLYSQPRIVSTGKLAASSAIFLNSKPDAIINIDISLSYTSLSFSLVNDKGFIEKTFDNSYFTKNKSLPSLEYFYSRSNVLTLNIKKHFILFTENYLRDGLDGFSKLTEKEKFISEIEAILLKKDCSTKEDLVSICQPKYIKAFFLIYIIHIKESILNMLSTNSKSFKKDLKIGYIVSVEKMVLDSTVGTKESFKELIYASGLISKNDPSKKLIAVTQGEDLIFAIQKYYKLEFILKSYFVLAQLYENYIQLTLNQVVTTSNMEDKEQETVIIQEETISIPNIYDSLCINMWNNIVRNKGLIQLCDLHRRNTDEKYSEIFLLKTKKEFMENLKEHISGNILKQNHGLTGTDKIIILLGSSCGCKVSLTINDIIDISFKPVLQDISFVLLASLINKDLFGNYTDIHYFFNLIKFNYNPKLQIMFGNILKEEADEFNLKQGIETNCLFLPELSDQMLKLVIHQQPYLYKRFHSGVLRQVYSSNYAFSIGLYSYEYLYKDKVSDTVGIKLNEDIAFSLFKKGDVISNAGFNKIFYLKKLNENEMDTVKIHFLKLKNFDGLTPNGTFSIKDNDYKDIYHSTSYIELNDYKINTDVPIMISVIPRGFSSSIRFCVKLIGEDNDKPFSEAGELMNLSRF